MNVVEQIMLGWQCLRFAFRQLASPALWAPWMMVGGVEALALAALWWFAHPWVSWFMAPLLKSAVGEGVLRYPNLFRALPALFSRVDLVVQASLGVLAAGVATALFAARAADRPASPAAAWRQAGRGALRLVLVNLPLTLIAVGLSFGLDAMLAARGSAPSSGRLAHAMALLLVFVAQAWFLYANALVMLGGYGWLGALATLPRLASRGMAGGLFMAVLTLLPLLAVQTLTATLASVVDRGIPETIGWLVVGQLALTLVSSFLLTGGAAVYYQSALTDSAEPA